MVSRLARLAAGCRTEPDFTAYSGWAADQLSELRVYTS
jgi:hypothetical protein